MLGGATAAVGAGTVGVMLGGATATNDGTAAPSEAGGTDSIPPSTSPLA